MEVPASKFDHLTFTCLWQDDTKEKKIQTHGQDLVFSTKSETGDPPELPLGAPDPHIWVTPKHPTNMLVDWP